MCTDVSKVRGVMCCAYVPIAARGVGRRQGRGRGEAAPPARRPYIPGAHASPLASLCVAAPVSCPPAGTSCCPDRCSSMDPCTCLDQAADD
ncbi:Protein of unknown function [Gryllus bimaculatus]|nr:Protein of unknown function [Gryllus bimaculatus]